MYLSSMRLLTGSMLIAGLSWGAVIGTETFDTDAAGFTANTISSVVVWDGIGGNPDGHIKTRRDTGQPLSFDIGAIGPNGAFGGNYGLAGVTGAKADFAAFTDNITSVRFRFRLNDGGVSNGWSYLLDDTFTPGTWESYMAPINPLWTDMEAEAAGWERDSSVYGTDPLDDRSWATIMANVLGIEIRVASGLGRQQDPSALAGIDNVGLVGGEVPEPSTYALMGVGVAALALLRRRRAS
jgi:hypothetical protein